MPLLLLVNVYLVFKNEPHFNLMLASIISGSILDKTFNY